MRHIGLCYMLNISETAVWSKFVFVYVCMWFCACCHFVGLREANVARETDIHLANPVLPDQVLKGEPHSIWTFCCTFTWFCFLTWFCYSPTWFCHFLTILLPDYAIPLPDSALPYLILLHLSITLFALDVGLSVLLYSPETPHLSHCYVEAVPGSIRRADRFVGFMKRFVEYLKVSRS